MFGGQKRQETFWTRALCLMGRVRIFLSPLLWLSSAFWPRRAGWPCHLQFCNAKLFSFFFFPASFFIALVGLTNEGDRCSKEQQISGDENGIRPLHLSVIPEVIQGSHGETSISGEPGWIPLALRADDLSKIFTSLNFFRAKKEARGLRFFLKRGRGTSH